METAEAVAGNETSFHPALKRGANEKKNLTGSQTRSRADIFSASALEFFKLAGCAQSRAPLQEKLAFRQRLSHTGLVCAAPGAASVFSARFACESPSWEPEHPRASP